MNEGVLLLLSSSLLAEMLLAEMEAWNFMDDEVFG